MTDGASSTGAIKESHGIGLAAMQERAELIGAKIDILTKVTEGTRLALKVPLTGIGETTVKTNIMSKLNVRDIAGLTRQAIKLKLVPID